MQRTLLLKLINPPIDELRCTMNAFRDACATLSTFIQNGAPVNRGRLHRRYYHRLRNQFCLPSQMAQSVIRVVVGAYRSKRKRGNKATHPKFRRPQVQYQYNRDWAFTKGLISLRTLTKRRHLQFKIGIYQQKKYIDDKAWSFGGASLVEREGNFYLHISLHKENKPERKAVTPIGIDRGIRAIAVARALRKPPLIVRGGKLTALQDKMVRLRRRLQAKGTRSARRVLRHLRRREKRLVLDVCRKTANQIIQYAVRHNSPVLVFEDLAGIRTRARRYTKKHQRQLHSWSYLLLKRVIVERAEELRIPVASENPAYTSQRCPQCGIIAKNHRRRDSYHCLNCKYQNNADVVAAINLAWQRFNEVDRIEPGVLSTTQTYHIPQQDVKYKPQFSISGS